MFYHLWSVLTIMAWLFTIIHPLSSENVLVLITCTTQVVHLNYITPLPPPGETVTIHATDSGTWSPCTVGGLNANVTYYLTVELSEANCEQANFTTVVFYGFFNIAPTPPTNLVNFTVVLSDPMHRRQLNVPQIFNGTLSTPSGIKAPPPANITFTFPATRHQNGTCTNVSTETVKVDPTVYLLTTNGTLDFLLG